ncbi:hypothetical protein Q8A67_018709 [Cirrhinus molitorella]|uniref:Uncharacterized protein n=1 Tax=Cirrhinus molitorella TaxID=172907 RepID=A0AA88TF06_9TELE|nr:hypothetical protein Q8A67_018709 [Cirrhinus molitorella]
MQTPQGATVADRSLGPEIQGPPTPQPGPRQARPYQATAKRPALNRASRPGVRNHQCTGGRGHSPPAGHGGGSSTPLRYHIPACDVRQLPSPHEAPGAVNIDAVSNRISFTTTFGEEKKMLMEKEPVSPLMLFTDNETSGCCIHPTTGLQFPSLHVAEGALTQQQPPSKQYRRACHRQGAQPIERVLAAELAA